ncbi:unnamed protein product, partial [Meganyctiphanes norvegica]
DCEAQTYYVISMLRSDICVTMGSLGVINRVVGVLLCASVLLLECCVVLGQSSSGNDSTLVLQQDGGGGTDRREFSHYSVNSTAHDPINTEPSNCSCFNGGECREGKNKKLECICPQGYSGKLCEAHDARKLDDADQSFTSPTVYITGIILFIIALIVLMVLAIYCNISL